MRYTLLILMSLIVCQASAETISGRLTKVRDNVAYLQTADGQKIPVILTEKTYYRKKKVLGKGKRTINATEIYQPLVARGDNVTLTYDKDTVDESTSAVKASDILIIVD